MLISSELPEIIGFCDRTIVMQNGKINGQIEKKNFSEELILKYASGYVNLKNEKQINNLKYE
jgi:inositol transport system ATP-binding protein